MKAQLSFEYFITLTLFVVFVVFLIFQVTRITPSFITELKNERIRSEAYQISELLINDPGEPTNWDTVPLVSIKRIGLSDNQKINLLSLDKINALQTMCSNYENVRNKLDTDYHFSVVLINKVSGDTLISCSSPTPPAKPSMKADLNRIVAIGEDSFGVMTFQMW